MAGSTEQSKASAVEVLARLNRIPVWALPRHYLAIIGLGYFFTFFDIADIGFAMPAIDRQFDLSGGTNLFLALAVGLIGYIVGSFVIGALADRFGRYRMLIATIILTAIGSFGDAFASGVITLIVFRFITGVGVGADLNLVTTYISELAPPAWRGRLTLYAFFLGILGQAVTPFVALGLVPNFEAGWRILFVIGGLIAVVGLVLRVRLPESPRWQVSHDHVDAARATVDRMEHFCRDRNIPLPEPKNENVDRRPGLPIKFLFQKPYAGRMGLLVAMWFFWYVGNYGFLGDAAELITGHGAAIGSSILFLAVGAIGYPIGTLVMLALVDRLERRTLILGSTIFWLSGMVLIAIYASPAQIFIGAFLASAALGAYLQVAYTFTAECFPTRARSTGFAFSDGLGHAGGAMGALLLPVVVHGWSFAAGFVIIGLTGLLAGLLALAGPAVTGRNLEQVSG